MREERWEGDSEFIIVRREGCCWFKWPLSDIYTRYDDIKQELRYMELVKAQPLVYEPKSFMKFINIGYRN